MGGGWKGFPGFRFAHSNWSVFRILKYNVSELPDLESYPEPGFEPNDHRAPFFCHSDIRVTDYQRCSGVGNIIRLINPFLSFVREWWIKDYLYCLHLFICLSADLSGWTGMSLDVAIWENVSLHQGVSVSLSVFCLCASLWVSFCESVRLCFPVFVSVYFGGWVFVWVIVCLWVFLCLSFYVYVDVSVSE